MKDLVVMYIKTDDGNGVITQDIELIHKEHKAGVTLGNKFNFGKDLSGILDFLFNKLSEVIRSSTGFSAPLTNLDNTAVELIEKITDLPKGYFPRQRTAIKVVK